MTPRIFSGTDMMIKKKLHIFIYILFVASILFDLATAFICFQLEGLNETNLMYHIVGVWAFPIVLLVDVVILFTIGWLRKHLKWSPIILFILIFFYVKAAATNLHLILSVGC